MFSKELIEEIGTYLDVKSIVNLMQVVKGLTQLQAMMLKIKIVKENLVQKQAYILRITQSNPSEEMLEEYSKLFLEYSENNKKINNLLNKPINYLSTHPRVGQGLRRQPIS